MKLADALAALALLSLLAGCERGAKAAAKASASSSDVSAEPKPRPKADSAAIEAARDRSPIKSDEVVGLFPAYAARTAEGSFRFQLHGWIYEPEDGDLVRNTVVNEVMEEIPDLDPTAKAIARARLGRFLVDNERDKKLTVTLAGKVFALQPSEEDGHFFATVELPEADARAWAEQGFLEVVVNTQPKDARRFAAWVQLVEPEGLTIISDVDDTIKVTEVTKTDQLLRRTFAMPFEVVPGMSKAYGAWAAPGAHLHFVSSSPWQLYDELELMARDGGFPRATWELKRVRPRDVPRTLDKLLADPLATKPPAIRTVMDSFPKRRVVLVGDSGEKDPEVYGLIARERPASVDKIYIRDVTGEPREAERYKAAFEGVPAERWVVFTDAATLPPKP